MSYFSCLIVLSFPTIILSALSPYSSSYTPPTLYLSYSIHSRCQSHFHSRCTSYKFSRSIGSPAMNNLLHISASKTSSQLQSKVPALEDFQVFFLFIAGQNKCVYTISLALYLCLFILFVLSLPASLSPCLSCGFRSNSIQAY